MKIRIKNTPLVKAQRGMGVPSRLTVPNFGAMLPQPQFNQMNNNYAARASMIQPPSFDYQKGMDKITGKFDPNAPLITSEYTPMGLPQSYVTPDMKMRAGADLYASDFNSFEDWEAKGSPALSTMPQMTPEKVDNRPVEYINPFDGAKALIGLGSNIVDYFDNRRKQKEFSTWMKTQQMSDNLFKPEQGSRGDYVPTGTSWGMFKPDQHVVNKGMYTAEMGGENPDTMNKIRIRITKGPSQMEYGGQANQSLDLNRRRVFDTGEESFHSSVSDTIQEVPREYANIEAEKGETVYGDIDNDGALEHMKIAGKRHTEGGTPLNVPEGSFIFSDTAKMRIKDEKILEYFGLSPRKGGYTPAEIAKRYDINKYKAIIEDPNADQLSKVTAESMIESYQRKLSQLALVQESMKGFPQGVPEVAKKNREETMMTEEPEMEDESMMNEEMMMEEEPMEEEIQEEMEYGGYIPQYEDAGQVDPTKKAIQELSQKYPWLKPWLKANTPRGAISPTGRVTTFNPNIKNLYERVTYWDNLARRQGVKLNSVRDLQKFAYNQIAKSDPSAIDNMWKTWGHTAVSDQTDVDNFADDIMGARTMDVINYRPPRVIDTKYKCTKNGVVSFMLDPNNPANKYMVYYDTYEQAAAACGQKKTPPSKKKPDDVEPGDNEFEGNDPLPFGYMAPDVFNMMATAMYPPKKWMPYMAPIDLDKPEPTFYDPNRELAANAEQANIQSQYLATFGNPQSYLANASAVQGKAAENAANTLSRYNNLNVGVANQFSPMLSEIENKERLLNFERANELYKGNVIANEQYRNAQRQYLNNIGKSYANAWNNRMNLGMLNAVNPVYRVDPRTGRSYFVKGYNPDRLASYSSGSGGMDWSSLGRQFSEAQRYLPGLTADRFISSMTGRSTGIDKDADGVYDSRRTTASSMIPGYPQSGLAGVPASAFGGPIIYPF